MYQRLLTTIQKTHILIILFIAMLIIGAAFYPLNKALDGEMLDMMSDSAAALKALGALTAEQKIIHIWGTLTADTLYPLSYGLFFAGLAARLAPRFGAVAAAPAIQACLVGRIL